VAAITKIRTGNSFIKPSDKHLFLIISEAIIMLNITDLTANKALDSKTMTSIRGGFDPFAILLDGSTSLNNKVADVDQVFAFAFTQNNAAAVTNNQAISGGNGQIYAPVNQNLDQYSDMTVSGIGNVSVS